MTDQRLELILRWAFGFSILAIYGSLAFSIALGHVEEKTSFGLREVLVGLGPLIGGFGVWAFGAVTKRSDNNAGTQ